MRALQDFGNGMRGFWRGVVWFTHHPGMMVLVLVPFLLAITVFVSGLVFFGAVGHEWLTQLLTQWFSSWSQEIWVDVVTFLIKAVVWFNVLLLSLVVSIALAGVVASPVYELISQRVEREILGEISYVVPWSQMIKVMAGEAAKFLIVAFVPLILLLIPGVNMFSGLIAAFLLGWDFYDYPLARRGWTLKARWQFVRSEFWTVLGFGVWLAIPVIHIVFVPLAIAGGTILNIEALQRRGLAAARVT